MSVAKDFCVISVRTYSEGKTHEWIFAILFSPNVYSNRLTKSGNPFFSPKQRGSEWKTTKSANALKISILPEQNSHYSFFRIENVREESSSLDRFTSSALTLQIPLYLCVFHVCSHKVPLTSVGKHVGIKCNCLQDQLLRLFLCVLVLLCVHCKKSH